MIFISYFRVLLGNGCVLLFQTPCLSHAKSPAAIKKRTDLPFEFSMENSRPFSIIESKA